jgi:hypothetical protein
MAAKILDIRNPRDLTTTYDQIEIRGSANSDMSSPTTLTSSLSINTATASDLSTGYTTYLDGTGYAYYQFRYKHSVSGATSDWSEIFAVDTTVMHTRFRRKMRDTNSQNYFFSNEDITNYLTGAITRLYPHTYNEVIDETLIPTANTYKYTFPIGIQRVNDLEYIDAQGNVAGRPNGWSIRAKQIIFDAPPSTGYIFRIYADKMFQKLAEIPEFLDDLILDLMRLQAYEDLEANRSQYYKYTTLVQPEGGNVPSIGRIIERLVTTTKERLQALRRTRRAADIRLV